MYYVMIIDDDEDFATATAAILKQDGYDVRVELDINSAEESIKRQKPDLVILDVMFPEGDSAGFSFSRRIENLLGTSPRVPILMLTGMNEISPIPFSSSDIDEKWLPVKDFLNKPVDFDILRKKVAALLKQ